MFVYAAQWEYTDEKAAVPANDELFCWTNGNINISHNTKCLIFQ